MIVYKKRYQQMRMSALKIVYRNNELLHLSQYLTNLMHKICFTISFISCLYRFREHVLIIRRSKLHHTASGIITPIGVMIPNKFCASSWLNTEINILRCTVSKT